MDSESEALVFFPCIESERRIQLDWTRDGTFSTGDATIGIVENCRPEEISVVDVAQEGTLVRWYNVGYISPPETSSRSESLVSCTFMSVLVSGSDRDTKFYLKSHVRANLGPPARDRNRIGAPPPPPAESQGQMKARTRFRLSSLEQLFSSRSSCPFSSFDGMPTLLPSSL
ncbi:hypothetical protein NL676_037776 [Syzygium grande]|nr:hypothetical protein NL676_037776 [Syzygium grande]